MIQYDAGLFVPGSDIGLNILTMSIQERQGNGWAGQVTIGMPVHLQSNVGGAYGWVVNEEGFEPGYAAIVKMMVISDSAGNEIPRTVVRTWPSIVTSVHARLDRKPDNTAEVVVDVNLVDPLTWLGNVKLWGVITNTSPAGIVASVLSLASGGSGAISLSPAIPGFPVIHISENVHSSLRSIPYVIAHGYPMIQWLFFVLSRLGVRIETVGDSTGAIGIYLKDLPPEGTPINILVETGQKDSPNYGSIVSMRYGSAARARGAILDNPSTGDIRHIGEPGAIGAVIDSARTNFDQASRRVDYANQFAALSEGRMMVSSGQPGLTPGRLVKIALGDGEGANTWQVSDITHYYSGGTKFYNNLFSTLDGATAWRPPVPGIDERLVLVSGVVEATDVETDESVERDSSGRIPVRLSFAQSEIPATDSRPAVPSPVIDLVVLQQIAGTSHGFLPSHRQGDLCRVAIRSPFFAEIVGFSYRNDFVADELLDTSAGMVVNHEQDDRWSGIVFRSKDVDDALNEDTG